MHKQVDDAWGEGGGPTLDVRMACEWHASGADHDLDDHVTSIQHRGVALADGSGAQWRGGERSYAHVAKAASKVILDDRNDAFERARWHVPLQRPEALCPRLRHRWEPSKHLADLDVEAT